MNKIKRNIIMPYLLACLLGTLHCLVMLFISDGDWLAWLGGLVAVAPMLGFMMYIGKGGVSSTSRYMPIQLVGALLGSTLVFYQFSPWPAFYAFGLGLVGVSAYVFWYSNLSRPQAPALQVGLPFPMFSFKSSDGVSVSREDLLGAPTLMIFYRGNWCPLCVAQVQQVADQYQALADQGVQVWMISSQAQKETQKLAARFQVPMRFLIDEGGRFAEVNQLLHHDVVPPGLGVDSPDAVYPTVVITGSDGIIHWLDLTDNYRVRPEPVRYQQVFASMPASVMAR